MDGPTGAKLTEPTRAISIEQLAPEILLQIVTMLPGLDTLWNLMRASPHTWRLFHNYALDITEGILSGPGSTLPLTIPELVRGVILVRSGILPFQSLEEFNERFMKNFLPQTYRNPQSISLGPELLSTSVVPVMTLRSVVATAYHLSALAQACLESCLARIRGPSFKPMHALDPLPNYVGFNPPPEDRVYVGTPVNVVDIGDPTWIEEMRALRAMWILQLVGEVQRLICDKSETIGWSKEDIATLNGMDPVDLMKSDYHIPVRQEEVSTAMHYVKSLGDATKSTYYRLPRAPPATVSARRTMALPKPNGDTLAVYGFRRGSEIHIYKGSPIPDESELMISCDSKWRRTESDLARESCGITRFRHLATGRYLMASPLFGVKFDSFRPLGFAFWDHWRMYWLGLTNGASDEWTTQGRRHLPYFYYFAMESILPPEEVISVKAALREKRALREQRDRSMEEDSI